MPFLSEMDSATGYVSADIGNRGAEFAETYRTATPFPHIVIDDFLPPEVLERCLAEFPGQRGEADVQFDRSQERYKSAFNPDILTETTRALFYSFNSRPFIRLVENICGIKGLVPDPYFLGGGFHEIGQGGHLSVHTDFNHHKPMNLERRINVLIYLNKDWKDDYGGQLEFWDTEMSTCVRSVLPSFNRCVIFNTTDSSFHGNPNPIKHPFGVTRKSIALYFYTSTWSTLLREQTTQFQLRPGSKDKPDLRVKTNELVLDMLPPIVLRNLRNIKKRYSRSASE